MVSPALFVPSLRVESRLLQLPIGTTFNFESRELFRARSTRMASILCLSSIIHINSGLHLDASCRLRRRSSGVARRIMCEGGISSPAENDSGSKSENAVLRLAWYGSELLGIAASLFRPSTLSTPAEEVVLSCRSEVAEAIKEDFARSYFVTGNLTLEAYEEDCEFADPAGSFKSLRRFKRNCSNFGALLERSNMKLTKWEDFEDKSIGHWRFSCVMSFPWRPILSATGYTEYYFDAQSGRVFRHVEHWNVPKMALLKQIFKPSRWVWEKR